MTRLPLFSWSIVVAGIQWVLTLAGARDAGDPGLGRPSPRRAHDRRRHGLLALRLGLRPATDLRPRDPRARASPATSIATFSRARDEFRRSISMVLVGPVRGAVRSVSSRSPPTATSVARSTPVKFDNPVIIFMSILIVLPVLGMLGQAADSFRRGRGEGGPEKATPLPGAVVVAAPARHGRPARRLRARSSASTSPPRSIPMP